MAVAEDRMRFRVYLDEGQRVAEIFVSQATKCRDIVQRLQRQIHATGCFLLEVWQGCERLVPDSESILSTLLEWGSDLEDVKFYLRRREEAPPFRQVVSGPLKVNGFKEETPLSRDVLLGGGGASVNDLKEFAARQQQEIAVKERELKTKQVQLMEMKRKSQKKPPNPYVQQLSAKVDEQSEQLMALRHVQDQVESYKLSNSALAEELDSIRSLFMEKEKELAIAVAKVESLTQQLDKQRQGSSQSSPSQEKTHQHLELQRLRKELMTRNELNHQQSVQIQSQKQQLAEKHKELFELDAQIEQYTEELRKKKSRNNHIDHENGSPSPTEEQEVLEMDHSNLGNFTKRGSTPNSADHKNGNASISSGSFRGRSRNSNKLETLLEVDEEVSDGHASNKSSTEDLTQGPGPPSASRVTAMKSRFETQGTTEEYDMFWDADDQLFHGAKQEGNNTAGEFANGFCNPSRRVEPEGVENPAMSDKERRASRGVKSVVADSLLRTKPCNEGVETKRGITTNVEGTSFEFPHSLEIKHILSESELKPEESPWNSGRSSPSDGGNGSGLSSPSSLSSLSSTSSNSTSLKSAVFAVTGVAKQTEISRYPSGSPQYENTIPNRSVSVQQDFEEHLKGNNLQPLRTGKREPRRPQDEVLKARQVKSEAFPTRNDSVGSNIRPTVLDFSRAETKPKPIAGGADESNNKKKVSHLNEERLKENDATDRRKDRKKSPSLTEDKPKQYDVTNNRNHTKETPRLTDEKTVASSVKAGNVKLSPLQYTTVFPPKRIEKHKTVDAALFKTSDVEDQVRRTKASFGDSRISVEPSVEANLIETKTEANAPSPSSPQNAVSSSGRRIQEGGEMMFSPSSGSSDTNLTLLENRKTIKAPVQNHRHKSELNASEVNASGPSRKGELEVFSPSMYLPGKTATLVGEEKKTESSFKDSNSEAELKTAASRSLNNDRSDGNGEAQSPSLSSAQLKKDHKHEQGRSLGDETDNAAEQKNPLIFKPISFRAKKLANEQRIDHTLNKPSQPTPLISNSISVRGQSSLTKITITPSSTYFPSAERDIPEKRSPVPTSKRPRFWNRVAPPTPPEEKDLLAISEFPSNENIRLNKSENRKAIVVKESFDEETAADDDSLQNEEVFRKSKGRNTNEFKGKTEQSQLKTREESRTDAKQVVSSVNIQLSSQKRQPSEEVKEVSSTREPVTAVSQIIKGKDGDSDSSSKQGQIHFGSTRLSSGSGRLNSESDQVDSKSGQLDTDNEGLVNGGVHPERVYKSENVENTSEGNYTESQRRHAVNNKNVSTSRFIKLSLPTQVSALSKDNAEKKSVTRESQSSVDADRSNVLSNGEPSHSESSSPRTSPGGNRDCAVLEEAEHVTSSEHLSDERKLLPVQGKSGQQNVSGLGLTENGVKNERGMLLRSQPPNEVETRQPITSKDLQDTVKGDREDIRLVSQSENTISDWFSSATAADSNAKSTRSGDTSTGPAGLSNRTADQSDDSSVSTVYQGQITSRALNSLSPARKTNGKKKAHRVSLDPHAVLLDAAVEGELDIVTQIVGEVDDPSKPNSEGITALHNAVCASHDEVVKFLVQYGCNINSQDSHGWTPLHCAAANNATGLSRFLIEHGACILAVTTLERKTPLQCCELGQPGFFNCTSYLNDIQQNFGLVNEGRVYALYSYSAIEEDELSFECGEEFKVLKRGDATEKEWWWAENEKRDTGYVPRNLLGSHPRVSPEV